MRISDWSSDVCSSDLEGEAILKLRRHGLMLEVDEHRIGRRNLHQPVDRRLRQDHWEDAVLDGIARKNVRIGRRDDDADAKIAKRPRRMFTARPATEIVARDQRSEEHTSELQSIMRISNA